MASEFDKKCALEYWIERFLQTTIELKKLGVFKKYEREIRLAGELFLGILDRKHEYSYAAIMFSVVPLEEQLREETKVSNRRLYG